ncbi:MAG: SNF2-related protein [Succinivibrio sp.]|nr:SNF2-related protein [Succinivibrio sp.]
MDFFKPELPEIRDYVKTYFGRAFLSTLLYSAPAEELSAGLRLLRTGKTSEPSLFVPAAQAGRSQSVLTLTFNPKSPERRALKLQVCNKVKLRAFKKFFDTHPQFLEEIKNLSVSQDCLIALSLADLRLLPDLGGHGDQLTGGYYELDADDPYNIGRYVCALALKLAHMLDADPCLMFSWRGFDIRKEYGIKAAPPEAPLELTPAEQRRKDKELDPKAYASTPWGQRFVAPFATEDNRDNLKRGKNDVTSGRMGVLSVSPKNCTVSGTDGKARLSKARAVFSFAPWDEDEKKKVTGILKARPDFLSELAVSRLPEGLVKEIEDQGIALFPDPDGNDALQCGHWEDRWGPGLCQHCLALMLKLAKSIDADPLMLFTLRGMSLSRDLKKLGITAGADKGEAEWKKSAEFWELGRELDLKDPQKPSTDDLLWHLNRLTYAKVPSGLSKALLTLLPETMPGLSGKHGAKEILKKTLDGAASLAREFRVASFPALQLPDFSAETLKFTDGGEEVISDEIGIELKLRRGDDPLIGDYNFEYHREKLVKDANGEEYLPQKYEFSPPWAEESLLFKIMHSGPAGMFNAGVTRELLDKSPAQTRGMYLLFLLASKLTAQGAVLPAPLLAAGDTLRVRWIPNVLSPQILTLTARAGHLGRALLEGGGISFEPEASKMSDAACGALLLGLFIGDYIEKGYRLSCGKRFNFERIFRATPELTVLFMCVSPNEKAIRERAARGIGGFLAPLYFGRRRMSPVLILENPQSGERSALDTEEALQKAGRARGKALLNDGFALPEENKEHEESALDLGSGKLVTADDHAAAIRAGFIDRQTGRYVSAAECADLPPERASECRRALMRIAALMPELENVAKGNADSAEVSLTGLQQALFVTFPALALTGVRLMLPRSMAQLLRPQAQATLKRKPGRGGGTGLMNLAALLAFDWKATLGGRQIPDEVFAELAKEAGHLVRFGAEYVFVSPEDAGNIVRHLEGKAQKPSKLELLEAALTGSFSGAEVFIDEALKKAIEKELKTPDAAVPEKLKATLRPYQERGYSWLMHNLRSSMGSIIADDMGLGKTVQVIAALENLREAGAFEKKSALIAVPASIVVNWQREVARFAPELTVNVFYGQGRSLDKKTDLVITTYGTVRSEIELLSKQHWAVVVADESQNLKNPDSQIFQDMCALRRDCAIAMSGTPVENRLADYWSVMEFVNPGLFGSLTGFMKEYANPIERERDADAVERLRRLTAPFILRRLKTDKAVISDLPDKISVDRYCELTADQAAIYQALVNEELRNLDESDTVFKRSAKVLQLILRLKQICDAPELYSKNEAVKGPEFSGKALAALDLISQILENGRKVIVFTQFKEMGDLLVSWITARIGAEPGFIHGGVPVKRRQEMVDSFQNDPANKVMVLSLKAAGTGLNLTAASAVIHYDLWWNPAVEDQATDRTYRIGQHQNVEVFRFICQNTFEERINAIISSKKELAEITVRSGGQWLGDMSKAELDKFLSLSSGKA